MENVAHTLAGLLVAETVIVFRRKRPVAEATRFATLAYVVSGVANNLPDADQLYTSISGGKLGYLMHHRGHTHTLPVGLLLGLLVAWIAVTWAKRRSGPLGGGDARWLYGLGALGAITHMTMDSWNVYGVHPFWPIYDGWIYGDAVFIVEPLFWLIGMPPLFFAAKRKGWKYTLAILFVAILVLTWVAQSFVPIMIRICLLVVAALAVLVTRRLSERARPVFGVVGIAVVALGFSWASHVARGVVLRGTNNDGSRVLDVALSSLPSNPLCFTGQVVEVDRAGNLVLSRVMVTPFWLLSGSNRCARMDAGTTAPLVPSDRANWGVDYLDEFRAPVARLRELASTHCEVAAAMRFYRVPYWIEEGDKIVIGDLRFDRSPGLDFADMELMKVPAKCPSFVPGWTPPRDDLLR